MQLELHVSKKHIYETHRHKAEYAFAVIDLDKAKTYPQNYLCILPSQFYKAKYESAFMKIFGNKSVERARELLAKKLCSENNPAAKAEIIKRLRVLN